jgi:hypothetical protein
MAHPNILPLHAALDQLFHERLHTVTACRAAPKDHRLVKL